MFLSQFIFNQPPQATPSPVLLLLQQITCSETHTHTHLSALGVEATRLSEFLQSKADFSL